MLPIYCLAAILSSRASALNSPHLRRPGASMLDRSRVAPHHTSARTSALVPRCLTFGVCDDHVSPEALLASCANDHIAPPGGRAKGNCLRLSLRSAWAHARIASGTAVRRPARPLPAASQPPRARQELAYVRAGVKYGVQELRRADKVLQVCCMSCGGHRPPVARHLHMWTQPSAPATGRCPRDSRGVPPCLPLCPIAVSYLPRFLTVRTAERLTPGYPLEGALRRAGEVHLWVPEERESRGMVAGMAA